MSGFVKKEKQYSTYVDRYDEDVEYCTVLCPRGQNEKKTRGLVMSGWGNITAVAGNIKM